MQNVVKLRGTKDGFLLNVKKGTDFEDFFENFKNQVMNNPQAFKGGKLVGIDGLELTDEQKRVVSELLSEFDVEITSFKPLKKETSKKDATKRDVSIETPKEETKDISYNTEHKRRVDELIQSAIVNMNTDEEDMGETLFYKGTVRSGIKLESDKHIVVVGDVNPGASLVAGGNIVVLGVLRGFAHAGSFGDEKALICAWKFKPTQLRIADYITIPPDDGDDEVSYPEVAVVENGRMIIKSYL